MFVTKGFLFVVLSVFLFIQQPVAQASLAKKCVSALASVVVAVGLSHCAVAQEADSPVPTPAQTPELPRSKPSSKDAFQLAQGNWVLSQIQAQTEIPVPLSQRAKFVIETGEPGFIPIPNGYRMFSGSYRRFGERLTELAYFQLAAGEPIMFLTSPAQGAAHSRLPAALQFTINDTGTEVSVTIYATLLFKQDGEAKRVRGVYQLLFTKVQ